MKVGAGAGSTDSRLATQIGASAAMPRRGEAPLPTAYDLARWPSRWPAEDGGPSREQACRPPTGLRISAHEGLKLAARRDAFASTMIVLRQPGEVYVLRHTLGRRPLRDQSECWVERLNPRTLEPVASSPRLPGGPFWPGGLAAHANGSLHAVHGRHCHCLSAALEPLATRQLPQPRPYNSFVALEDGTLVMKEIDRDLHRPAHLSLLDPETLEPRGPDQVLDEPSIARLSAQGSTLYVVGATTVWRYHWDGRNLKRDDDWQFRYHGGPSHSYGWDPVISGGHVWFLDNGAHAYSTTMRGAGLAAGPIRLLRVSTSDSADVETVEVSGTACGTATNPPVYDPERRIAVAYDSGNGVVQAFSFDGRLRPLWRAELDHAAHMILFPATGELVLHHHRGPRLAQTNLGRRLGQASSGLARSPRVREALAGRAADEVVIVDIETGQEKARCPVPTMFQSVLFPAPGFERDLYWVTFSTLARLEVVSH
jgi:hypothetical protein